MNILFYGKKKYPVLEFIETLNPKDKAKVLACLKSIEELGFDSPRVAFRQIFGKLWEVKIKTSSGQLRIFYVTLKLNKIVLLHAYSKKSQKAPLKEISIAEKRLMEVIKDESFYIR